MSVFAVHLAETLLTHLYSHLPFSLKKTLADIIILWLLKLGMTMLIHNKDDIEFVTEFPCLLEHPVQENIYVRIIILNLDQKISFNLLIRERFRGYRCE